MTPTPFQATANPRLVGLLDMAAASGIVCLADRLYVIADDQLELTVYNRQAQRQQRIALLPGALPIEHAARKARKPDFEALLALPDGSLLALGSGSTSQRERGVWVQQPAAAPSSSVVDLTGLYSALRAELPELNIEGGAVLGPHLYLCSRGNGARLENALIALDLGLVLASLHAAQSLTADSLASIQRVHLPGLDGTPLSLTDLAVYESGLVFCAAAEASANTYDDAECAGSAVGKLARDGTVSELVRIASRIKLEGICSAGAGELYAVADADDPAALAPLLVFAPWPSSAADGGAAR